MNKVRLFLNSIVLTALTLSISLQAGISPLAFNGIFKCFKKPEFAPNLGCAALQTGLVNNIRFCMVEPGEKDAHGNRLWIKDKAPTNDPVAALAILLFPSPAGSLTAVTSHPDNIGRHLTVEHVAQLLNFCAHVRKVIPHMGGNRFGKNAVKSIGRLVAAANKKLKPHAENYFSKFFEPEIYSPDVASRNTLRSLLKYTNQGRELLTALCKVIELEERCENLDAQFYPKFQAEQLLNAFFCLKFGQEDIPTLLANLDDSIVDHEMLPKDHLIDQSDLEEIAQKQPNQIGLDDLWVLQNRDLIKQVIPYAHGSKPINNGLASGYNRGQDCLVNIEYPDCVETLLRIFLNLMLYSGDILSFDLSLIKTYLKNSSLLKNLEDFYALQRPDQANAGARTIRDSFSKIVSGLGHSVRYKKKSVASYNENDTELASGIINVIQVLSTLLNTNLSSVPTYQNYQQFEADITNWIHSSLDQILTLLAPQKKITIQITNVFAFQTPKNYASQRNECYEYDCGCLIKITVNRDFIFTMNIGCGHAQIDAIDIITPIEHSINPNLLRIITEKISSFFQGTVGESLLLLDSEIQKTITQPIYSLFQHDLRDSTQMIQVLEKLYSITNSSQISIEHAAPILQNCLQNFEWKNYRMMSRIQRTIKKWLKLAQKPTNELISQILQTEVQAIQYKFFKDHFDNVDDLLNYFHSASMVFLEGNVGNIFLPTQNHTSIKIIDFTDSEVEQVTISYDAFPNLEILDLSSTDNLQSFKLLGSLHKLKKISFESSSISKIKISGENCPNLEIIDVNDTNELEVFTLSNAFKKLNTIDLSNSAIPELAISGDNFPKLQNIDLSNTKSLENLKLTGSFEWLKKLNLSFSEITQLKLADEYPNLEILDLRNTEQLESLELSGSFEKLNQILLSSSAITKLELEGKTFPALKNIELGWTNNLQRVELSSNFEQLIEIGVANSAVAKVIISGICPNLKTDDSKIIFVSP